MWYLYRCYTVSREEVEKKAAQQRRQLNVKCEKKDGEERLIGQYVERVLVTYRYFRFIWFFFFARATIEKNRTASDFSVISAGTFLPFLIAIGWVFFPRARRGIQPLIVVSLLFFSLHSYNMCSGIRDQFSVLIFIRVFSSTSISCKSPVFFLFTFFCFPWNRMHHNASYCQVFQRRWFRQFTFLSSNQAHMCFSRLFFLLLCFV